MSKLNLKPGPINKSDSKEKIRSEEIRFLIEILRSYFGHALLKMEIGNERFWQSFVSKISFIDDGAKLNPSQDANSPIVLPSGCKIVQIAFWDDSEAAGENGVLYIDKSYWEQLDSINKVALLAHEYFFKEARQAGFKNSDFVRAKIGKLFSSEGLPPLVKNWTPAAEESSKDILPLDINGYKYCYGSVADDPSSGIQLFLYNGNQLAIPIIKSKRLGISSLQPVNFIVGPRATTALELAHVAVHTKGGSEEDINFWMRETAISRNDDLKRGLEWLESKMEFAANDSKALWTSQLATPTSVMQISLENPIFRRNDQIATTPKDASAQIFAIIQKLLSTPYPQLISGAAVGAMISDPVKDKVIIFTETEPLTDEKLRISTLNAFSVLNQEVDRSIKNGKYPEAFPKWTAALESLSKKMVRPYTINNAERYMAKVRSFPELLYKSKIGILSETEKARLVRDYEQIALDPHAKKNYYLQNGRLSLQSDSQKVTFDLNCADAGLVYNDNNKMPNLSSEVKSSEVTFTIDSAKFTDDSQILNFEIAQTLRRISGRSTSKPPFQQDGWTIYEQISLNGTGAKSLKDFLSRTDSVKILSCEDFSPVFGGKRFELQHEDLRIANCLVINITENNSFFMVKTSEPTEEVFDNNAKTASYYISVRAIIPPKKRKLDDFVF
ncbi:hypothetical protein [Bdellovibrio bacteriovorus]|uniref:hypothetical protein n=1 Tax=Bdellovibrio bacteriovorus TaxID=959 RepID=UPI0012F93696|nr:hypothetical protein [Bdellovibrio bacteriovorus]